MTLKPDPPPGACVRLTHPSHRGGRPPALVLASGLVVGDVVSWLCLVLKAGQVQPETVSKVWTTYAGLRVFP